MLDYELIVLFQTTKYLISYYSFIDIATNIEITTIMECQISRVILSYNSANCLNFPSILSLIIQVTWPPGHMTIAAIFETDLSTVTHSEWDSSNCPTQKWSKEWEMSEILPQLQRAYICYHWVKIAPVGTKFAPISDLTQLPHLRLAGLLWKWKLTHFCINFGQF